MINNAILLSIRPQYAQKIIEGKKTVELRRIRPKHLRKGTLVLLYVSSPIKSIVGAFKVKEVLEKPLEELWEQIEGSAGVTREEFDTYYEGVSKGIGILFEEIWCFSEPIQPYKLEEQSTSFHPPQGFRYATSDEVVLALQQLADFVSEEIPTQGSLFDLEEIID